MICGLAVGGVYIYTKQDKDKIIDLGNGDNPTTSENDEKFNAKFDQVVFLGDSITMGYVTYNKVPTTQVIHKKGLSAEGMFTNNLYYMDESRKLEDILENFKPKMLYIGFGMNDLRKTPSEFYEVYKKNIEKVKSICPNTKLALISITPINTDEFDYTKVDAFNQKIKQISDELGDNCYYININNLLEDSEGKLKDEYNSGDGIHIKPEAYDVILDYYKKNLQQ